MWKLFVILLSGLALFGCGESELQQARTQDQKTISDLKSQVVEAREALDARLKENEQLAKQVQDLTQKVGERERLLAAKAEQERKPAKGKGEEGRVELMGAKAIAEYKAEQLSRRVEKLTQDLNAKEQEVSSIRQNAQQQNAEVEQLRQRVAALQKAEQTRTTELQSKLDSIAAELKERSAAAEKFKQELDEKTGLLSALKNAVSDASKLKSGAEAEGAKLREDLAEALKQLEAAQGVAGQAREETAKVQAYNEQIQQKLAEWMQYGEQMKQEVERLTQQVNASASEISQLREQLQAAQAKLEEHAPSTIDRIIGGPESKEEAAPGRSSSLF